jgi:TolB protein
MIRYFLTILIVLITQLTFAKQSIEIVGGNAAGLPKIAIINFNGNSNISDIIAHDLSITGEFDVSVYKDIKNITRDTKYTVIGNVNESTVIFNLTDSLRESSVLDGGFKFDTQSPRRVAHSISNMLYKTITNIPGIFNSKIAYISKNNQQYAINIADYDGYNQQTIFQVNAPIISLTWSHDGKQIAYTTFELNKPVTYVQDVYNGQRYIVADYSGSNSAPTFLPNDKQLITTLTKDGGSHLFTVDNKKYHKKSAAVLLFKYGTIDTEANIATDGSVVFTSNHDGGPQIFLTNISAKTPQRLTINLGDYNTSAKLSHDLKSIVFINRNQGILKTYIINLSTGVSYPITTTNLDNAPSFAPNDKLVLLSSDNNLYIANTLGTIETKLSNINTNIIDQEWSDNY